jgi:hypothetical protein
VPSCAASRRTSCSCRSTLGSSWGVSIACSTARQGVGDHRWAGGGQDHAGQHHPADPPRQDPGHRARGQGAPLEGPDPGSAPMPSAQRQGKLLGLTPGRSRFVLRCLARRTSRDRAAPASQRSTSGKCSACTLARRSISAAIR